MSTDTLTAAPTSTPLPTKEVLLQFGGFGGDGGMDTDSYFGRNTPELVLYSDGQLLVQKSDDQGRWFEEAELSVKQICTLLSQIEDTGFFDVEGNGLLGERDSIYNFDNSAQFSAGGPEYVIQVNGPKHKIVNVYYDYAPYLIQPVKQVLNLFLNYSSPERTKAYVAKYLLLWIEEGPGASIYSTPAPNTEAWPADVAPLAVLKKDSIETLTYIEDYHTSQVSQVLVEGNAVEQILALFGDRLASRLIESSGSQFYVIARPLLPHETPQSFSQFPNEVKEFELPFTCEN